MSEDIHEQARQRYQRATAFIRQGWVTRAELEQQVLGYDAVPAEWPVPPFSPLRNSLEAVMDRAAAERRDRTEWIQGIRRRLGLVAEVHRCRVYGADGSGFWAWMCQRAGCDRSDYGYLSQPAALARALAHTCSFVPQPPGETPVTELDLLAFDAAWAVMRAQQERMAAALPARMSAVAEEINSTLAGLLPDGMRFEWGPQA